MASRPVADPCGQEAGSAQAISATDLTAGKGGLLAMRGGCGGWWPEGVDSVGWLGTTFTSDC
jgi:hypothetical protein